MRLGDLKTGDLFRSTGDGKSYELLGWERNLVKVREVAMDRRMLADPDEAVQLTHRQVENLPVNDWFYSRLHGNWYVLARYESSRSVIASNYKNEQRQFHFGELVEPRGVLRREAASYETALRAGVRHVIGRLAEAPVPVSHLDDDKLWEQTLAESRRWHREAMAESIRRLGGYQHGCEAATARFEELHRICEFVGLEFWQIAFNMVGFAACRLIISSVLKSKGFKDGAKEVAVHSDPAKDPRGDLVERIFRQDFI